MNRRIIDGFLVMIAIVLMGCTSAQMVYRRDPPAWPKGGLIRYWIDENTRENQHRRDDTYKKIYDFCKGPYRIIKEDNTYGQEGGTYLLSAQMFHRETSKDSGYWYINFECLSTDKTTPSDRR